MKSDLLELNLMKRFSLEKVSESLGFLKISSKSTKSASVMKNDVTGHKIVVSQRPNGHQTYFLIGGDEATAGTFIDLLQLVHGPSFGLGKCRQFMRRLMGNRNLADVSPARRHKSINSEDVRKRFYEVTNPLQDGKNEYLNNERKLSSAFLKQGQFRKSIFEDRYGNAIFPHRDRSGGVSGYSIRGKRKLFSKGGVKSLWYADALGGAASRKTLCVSEAAISVLSFASLNYDSATCYMATSGSLSKRQTDFLESAFEKLVPEGHLVIAADADDAGRKFATRLTDLWQRSGRMAEACFVRIPDVEGADWNDILVSRVDQAPS